MTYVAAYRREASGKNSVPFGGDTNARGPLFWRDNNYVYTQIGGRQFYTTSTITNAGLITHVSSIGTNAASARIRINGITRPLTEIGAGAITYSTIGGPSHSSQQYHDGALCEIIVYTRQLTTNEYQTIESYLVEKWGGN
jgi:hypothetical protein